MIFKKSKRIEDTESKIQTLIAKAMYRLSNLQEKARANNEEMSRASAHQQGLLARNTQDLDELRQQRKQAAAAQGDTTYSFVLSGIWCWPLMIFALAGECIYNLPAVRALMPDTREVEVLIYTCVFSVLIAFLGHVGGKALACQEHVKASFSLSLGALLAVMVSAIRAAYLVHHNVEFSLLAVFTSFVIPIALLGAIILLSIFSYAPEAEEQGRQNKLEKRLEKKVLLGGEAVARIQKKQGKGNVSSQLRFAKTRNKFLQKYLTLGGKKEEFQELLPQNLEDRRQ